mgnify:CR=1 FL=1
MAPRSTADRARRRPFCAAPETLPPLFAGKVDRGFHLGATCNFSTPYAVLHRVNVEGVEQIPALALVAGVPSFVHVGSTGAYGPCRGRAFTKMHPASRRVSANGKGVALLEPHGVEP